MMAVDKKKAVKGMRRISEKTLMIWAFIGGAFGMLISSRLFHHKTKKNLFRMGLPIFLTIHIIIIFFILSSL